MLKLRFAVAAITLHCACGTDAPKGAGVPRDDFCDRWAEAICEAASRCECPVGVGEYGQVCPQLATGCDLEVGPIADALAAGEVEYDDEGAARYLTALRESSCEAESFLEGYEPHERATRLGAFPRVAATGTLPDGEPCTEDRQCESGRCDFATSRCRALEDVGEFCVSDDDCASNVCVDSSCRAGPIEPWNVCDAVGYEPRPDDCAECSESQVCLLPCEKRVTDGCYVDLRRGRCVDLPSGCSRDASCGCIDWASLCPGADECSPQDPFGRAPVPGYAWCLCGCRIRL